MKRYQTARKASVDMNQVGRVGRLRKVRKSAPLSNLVYDEEGEQIYEEGSEEEDEEVDEEEDEDEFYEGTQVYALFICSYILQHFTLSGDA